MLPRMIEFKAEDLPVTIRLTVAGEVKEYVLVKTKQDRLLLNKPQKDSRTLRL
jgi:hypothetical protein